MQEKAVKSKDPRFGGALISPQGHVLAVIAVSEAGQGLCRGEVRGLTFDQAERMFRLRTAVPYTGDGADKRLAQAEKAEREKEQDETGLSSLEARL
jgi:hypothetical protein